MPLKRVPNPNSDANAWGTILNEHLSQTHRPTDGGLNKFELFSQRPTGLTTDDQGKTFLFTQTGNFHEWTGTAWIVLNESVVNVKDYGAWGDGQHDDTAAIQAAIDKGANMFNQAAYPPAFGSTNYPPEGRKYDTATVMFDHGAYRITNTIDVYTGLTVTGRKEIANTVSVTRIIMDTNSGTTNQNKHIFNLTNTFNGAVRNSNNTGTISDLEFWIINPGASIDVRTGVGWPLNTTNDNLGSFNGCGIYSNVAVVDYRINRCNFYSIPNAAIMLDNTNSSTKLAGNLFIEDCEFDTPIVGVRVKNLDLNLVIKDTEFFDSSYGLYVQNCIGKISMFSNTLISKNEGGGYGIDSAIKITDNSTLGSFTLAGNTMGVFSLKRQIIFIEKTEAVTISSNTFHDAATYSCVTLIDCDGGVINGNTFINLGYNAPPDNLPQNFTAAIKLIGCKNVNVSGNTIMTPGVATYENAFGILCLDNGATRSSRNLISNNIVSAKYDIGFMYNGQKKSINVTSNDLSSGNLI